MNTWIKFFSIGLLCLPLGTQADEKLKKFLHQQINYDNLSPELQAYAKRFRELTKSKPDYYKKDYIVTNGTRLQGDAACQIVSKEQEPEFDNPFAANSNCHRQKIGEFCSDSLAALNQNDLSKIALPSRSISSTDTTTDSGI